MRSFEDAKTRAINLGMNVQIIWQKVRFKRTNKIMCQKKKMKVEIL